MERIDLDGIAVALRRSARARRMTLRVGRTDGAVTLTLPSRIATRDGRAFLLEHRDWIARQVAAAPPRVIVRPGVVVPFEGRAVPVLDGSGRSACWAGDGIAVPDDGRAGPRVAALLREAARGRLTTAVTRHAAAVGRAPRRITLRDPRSRWGSCSARGDLMFSWRLVMAPPDVLDYVAAHEAAHLRHMDHSPRFWARVAELMPGYADPRAWLRREGAALHAHDFAPCT